MLTAGMNFERLVRFGRELSCCVITEATGMANTDRSGHILALGTIRGKVPEG